MWTTLLVGLITIGGFTWIGSIIISDLMIYIITQEKPNTSERKKSKGG
jgi:hypothetical protein